MKTKTTLIVLAFLMSCGAANKNRYEVTPEQSRKDSIKTKTTFFTLLTIAGIFLIDHIND